MRRRSMRDGPQGTVHESSPRVRTTSSSPIWNNSLFLRLHAWTLHEGRSTRDSPAKKLHGEETYIHTLTSGLLDWIGPVGRFGENPDSRRSLFFSSFFFKFLIWLLPLYFFYNLLQKKNKRFFLRHKCSPLWITKPPSASNRHSQLVISVKKWFAWQYGNMEMERVAFKKCIMAFGTSFLQ